jgi:predicted ribosomally synthesized peptide with nif11-like leader
MSVEEATAFYDRLSRDEAFLAAILTADGREERLRLTRQEGYNFDQAELEEATARFLKKREYPRERQDEAARVATSLLDVVMVRVTAEYGDVSFFEESGPLRLSPREGPSS